MADQDIQRLETKILGLQSKIGRQRRQIRQLQTDMGVLQIIVRRQKRIIYRGVRFIKRLQRQCRDLERREAGARRILEAILETCQPIPPEQQQQQQEQQQQQQRRDALSEMWSIDPHEGTSDGRVRAATSTAPYTTDPMYGQARSSSGVQQPTTSAESVPELHRIILAKDLKNTQLRSRVSELEERLMERQT